MTLLPKCTALCSLQNKPTHFLVGASTAPRKAVRTGAVTLIAHIRVLISRPQTWDSGRAETRLPLGGAVVRADPGRGPDTQGRIAPCLSHLSRGTPSWGEKGDIVQSQDDLGFVFKELRRRGRGEG